MAFIQLQAEADNPNKAFLVNTDQIGKVTLSPYTGTDAVTTHIVQVSVSDTAGFVAYFTSLESARTAYDRLNTYLNSDATTIQLY